MPMQKSTTDTLLLSAKEKVRVSEEPKLIEEPLLASLLQELDAITDIEESQATFNAFYAEIIRPIQFSNQRSKILWWVLKQLDSKGNSLINSNNAIEFLSTHTPVQLDMFAGTGASSKPRNPIADVWEKVIEYIEGLLDKEVDKSADEYLSILKFAYANVQYHEKLKQLTRRLELTGNHKDLFSEMAEMLEEYNKATGQGYVQSSKKLSELDKEHLADILHHASGREHYLPTADSELNDLLFGYPRGKISLITGSSGHGKSLHTLRSAYAAYKKGHCVFYISLEMDESDVIKYLISIALNKPTDQITDITSKQELDELVNSFYKQVEEDGKNGGIFIYDIAMEIDREDLMNIISVHTELLKVDGLYIDHFSQLQNPNPQDVKGMYYFHLAKELINVAKHYNLAIVGAVHYSNEAAKGENSRMYQEGISDSAHWRKEAGLILGVYRPKGDLMGATYFSWQVLKNREQGKTFGQELVYMTPLTSFTPIIARKYKTITKVEQAITKELKRMEEEI